MNLLPIPIMDGGVILMLLVEMVMQRDLSLNVKEAVFKLGFVCIVRCWRSRSTTTFRESFPQADPSSVQDHVQPLQPAQSQSLAPRRIVLL